MPTKVSDRVLSWATDIDPNTITQAEKASVLPFISGHIALMPDAHVGKGATVGSVIPTKGAVIPAAVGVDIGCGMIAVETDLTSDHLPDSLDPLLSRIGATVPAGVGQGHDTFTRHWTDWLNARFNGRKRPDLTAKEAAKASTQFGSLGSGNHFVEVCLDDRDHVWLVLHSGSRGVGNMLATRVSFPACKASMGAFVLGADRVTGE
jgi:RNA-splicing ligase RtcB